MLSSILTGIGEATQLSALVANLVGVIVGITFGSMPGLTFSTGLILLLPVTFAFDPVTGISLLVGVFIGGMTGGSVSAILLGIPGTPSAAATVIDGYPLKQKGMAGKALGMAVIASIFAGLVSLLLLILVAPLIAKVALQFGSVEIFALVLFGLSTIISVSSGSVIKGLIAGIIGLMAMEIGLDPVMGVHRFTLGYEPLQAGIDLLAAMIGLFAIPQIIKDLPRSQGETGIKIEEKGITNQLPSWQEIKSCFGIMVRGALMGTGIGSIPGTGGPIAAFLSYETNKRMSKHPEKWGTGILEGVAAPEAANNGVTGGALIPMLTLGIPGDPGTAILLGALLIHGLQPGPLLFQNNADVVYGIFAALFIANILTLIVQWFGIRLFVKILQVPKTILLPAIMVLTIVGSFAVRNNLFDVYVMAVFGVIGYFLERYDFPTTPVILAIVLGPTLETEMRRAIIAEGTYTAFFTHPISAVFIFLTLVMLFGPTVKDKIAARRAA
ncbi:tripartite tricarboxylate transporter permease [Moorella sulfitireducens]|uniref:tripartite tricarboxylate transporter permease n=1 Tax=Neomoorella sulfitireducens TaxID=2972948 RepID=UPI0021AC9025|nr:tripartite tricarboxylate transporter permease [Moorella sulfitireducens]